MVQCVVVSAIRQEKKLKGIHIGEEERKLYSHDMIIYIEKSDEMCRIKFTGPKVVGCKIKI